MSNAVLALDQQRFLATLEIVWREGQHLLYSQQRLFAAPIDAQWVIDLAVHPEIAERLEAFVSRYSRMQDTIGEKLLPRWLRAQGERSTTLIDTLNHAEKLGLLKSAEQWIMARQLRNSLIHEYMTDPAEFAQAINLAGSGIVALIGVYNALLQQTKDELKLNTDMQILPYSGLPASIKGVISKGSDSIDSQTARIVLNIRATARVAAARAIKIN